MAVPKKNVPGSSLNTGTKGSSLNPRVDNIRSNVPPSGGRMSIDPPRPNPGNVRKGDAQFPRGNGGGTVNINPPGKMPIPRKGGGNLAEYQANLKEVSGQKRAGRAGNKEAALKRLMQKYRGR